MSTAAVGSFLGDNCKLYYSATLGGAGAVTEVPQVIDLDQPSSYRTADSICRGDAEISTHVGKKTNTITMNLLAKRGSQGTAFEALRTAYHNKTVLAFAVASGEITDIDQIVTRLEGRISEWNETQPDGDTVKVAATIVKAPDNSYATNTAIVSA